METFDLSIPDKSTESINWSFKFWNAFLSLSDVTLSICVSIDDNIEDKLSAFNPANALPRLSVSLANCGNCWMRSEISDAESFPPSWRVWSAVLIVDVLSWNVSIDLEIEPSSVFPIIDEKVMGSDSVFLASAFIKSYWVFQSSIDHPLVSLDCLMVYNISKSEFVKSLVNVSQSFLNLSVTIDEYPSSFGMKASFKSFLIFSISRIPASELILSTRSWTVKPAFSTAETNPGYLFFTWSTDTPTLSVAFAILTKDSFASENWFWLNMSSNFIDFHLLGSNVWYT